MFRIRKSLPKLARFALLAGLALFAAACATDTPSPLAPLTAGLEAVAGKAPSPTTGGDTLIVSFTINPQSSTSVMIGDHWLVIPQNTLCDPRRSTYGPTECDQPCKLATQSVSMSVKSWTNAQNAPQLDFSRDLRFVPSDKGELPKLSLNIKDKSAMDVLQYNVLYCALPTSPCIDESLTDPTLATQTDATNGFLYRMIKHFSGYNVWA